MNNEVFRTPKFIPTGWLITLMGLAGTLLTAGIAGSFYLAELSAKVSANEMVRDRVLDRLESIDQRLSRIEGKISR